MGSTTDSGNPLPAALDATCDPTIAAGGNLSVGHYRKCLPGYMDADIDSLALD
jgi:hypothetical protein